MQRWRVTWVSPLWRWNPVWVWLVVWLMLFGWLIWRHENGKWTSLQQVDVINFLTTHSQQKSCKSLEEMVHKMVEFFFQNPKVPNDRWVIFTSQKFPDSKKHARIFFSFQKSWKMILSFRNFCTFSGGWTSKLHRSHEGLGVLVDHHVMGGGRSYRSQRGRKAKIGRCQMVGWLVDLLVMSLKRCVFSFC